jgi:hypothetical protein
MVYFLPVKVHIVDPIRTPGNLHFLAGSGSTPPVGSGPESRSNMTTFILFAFEIIVQIYFAT